MYWFFCGQHNKTVTFTQLIKSSWRFTHLADTEKHYHSLGDGLQAHVNQIFTLFLALFGFHRFSREKSHALAAKCFPMFTSELQTLSVVWRWTGKRRCWEQWNWTKNSQVAGWKTKTMTWKMLQSSGELRGPAESGDTSLWVYYCQQPPSHYTVIWPLLIWKYWLEHFKHRWNQGRKTHHLTLNL